MVPPILLYLRFATLTPSPRDFSLSRRRASGMASRAVAWRAGVLLPRGGRANAARGVLDPIMADLGRRVRRIHPSTSTVNRSDPAPAMPLGLSGRLIARSAYCDKIGVELSERCPLRRAWLVLGQRRSLRACFCGKVEILRPNPRSVKIGQADRGRQHRGYRQPSPTKYLGDLRSQSTYPVRCCSLPDFRTQPCLKAENSLSATRSGIR